MACGLDPYSRGAPDLQGARCKPRKVIGDRQIPLLLNATPASSSQWISRDSEKGCPEALVRMSRLRVTDSASEV